MVQTATHLSFLEFLNKAIKAQAHYAQDHPQSVQSMASLLELVRRVVGETGPFDLTVQEGTLHVAGQAASGSPHASLAVQGLMSALGIRGINFQYGIEEDDLQLLFFVLLMRPQRCQELGGPRALLPADGPITILLEGEDAPPAAPLVSVADLALGPRVLADDLQGLFTALVQMTSQPLRPDPRSPWTLEQREVLGDYAFTKADLDGLHGIGDQLGLSRVEPGLLRQALRAALMGLSPTQQGAILLALPTCPSTEPDLRLALDYLAPELMATALADAHHRRPGSKVDLALAAASMLQCIKDRDLALEALKAHLMLTGWTMTETDQLEENVRWECHGTDTKLHLALRDRSVFELDPHQVSMLLRQLVRGRKQEGLRDLIHQLETGLSSTDVNRRRIAAECLADLAGCLEDGGLPAELEPRLLAAFQPHLSREEDPLAARWSCQGLEALMTNWMHARNFSTVYAQMLALGQIALMGTDSPDWKVAYVKDLLSRLASPPNIALLVPLLHQRDGQVSVPQLHALLTLMGRPAAAYLLVCLELEEDRNRRAHLIAALGAIGRNAVPALVDALASPHWYVVRNALAILETIDHKAAFPHVVLSLNHRDPRVRRAAVQTVGRLGAPGEANAALLKVLPECEPETQLEILNMLGELAQPGAVPAIEQLVTSLKGSSGETARVRIRAVETLGRLGFPEAIPTLQELFRKRGLLSSREGTAIRLTAVRALAAMPARESREALTMILDAESDEDVRSVVRTLLING